MQLQTLDSGFASRKQLAMHRKLPTVVLRLGRAIALSSKQHPCAQERYVMTAATSPHHVSKFEDAKLVGRFAGLHGDDFRHPLDRQFTTVLQSLPGVDMVAKNLLGPVAEQLLLLENIGTSVRVGPDQLRSVHKLLAEAAHILDMDAPELYIRQSPVPNAYTLAIAGRKPFIVMHTSLMDLLSPQEIQAVLAHELGHLKCDHGVWLTVANLLATGTVSVFPVFSQVIEEQLMRWLRATEFTCDRAALLVTQDRRIVISALMKLAGGSKAFQQELNVDAFLQQARSYDEATRWGLGWYLRNAQSRNLSHPLPVMRAREIDTWASSYDYTHLLGRNRGSGSKQKEAAKAGATKLPSTPMAAPREAHMQAEMPSQRRLEPSGSHPSLATFLRQKPS